MAKIAFLSTRFNLGGAQLVAARLAKELSRRGHATELWYLYETGSFDTAGLRTATMLQRPPRGPVDIARIIARLWQRLRTERPEVIVGFQPLANVLGTTLGALTGVRSRVGTNGNPPDGHRFATRWLEWAVGASPIFTDNVAVTGAVKQSFAHFRKPYLQKMQVIYNGVARIDQACDRTAARRALDIPDAWFCIGGVGRLSAQKGWDFLVELLPNLADTHLLIGGDGETKEALQQQARDLGVENRVHLLGKIDPDRVGDVYVAADVVTIPSRYEGFCLTLVEAMQCGRPIIGSDLPALQEVAGDPRGAVLLSTEDPARWIEEIERLRCSPEAAAMLVARASARADAFSVERMVDAYEGLFLKRLAG